MSLRIPDHPLVVLALAAALAAGCHGAEDQAAADPAAAGHDDAGPDAVAHYTCSMHPSVRNAGPGTCPMCSMALAPVFQRELDSGEIVLDAGRRRQIGVTTARVELRPLTGPLRAVGMVTYDQSRLTDVTLRVGGWIDELYADRIGQRVTEGEPLFTLFSPDLFEAQQDYAEALEKLKDARMLGSPLIPDLVLETRRQRLRLADLGPDELDLLERRLLPVERVPILAPASGHVIEKNVVAGAAVSPGTTLLRIAGLDRVWVEAEVYESELPTLAVGDPATVTLRYLPGREFRGRIAFVYPWLDRASRTGRVRVELANPGLALKPEMYAEVVFERDRGERLAVPESAVLYAGDRDYVFLDLGDGRLRPQAVKVGGHDGEWVEVLDGVGEGDVVVTSGNFLVAAEARLGLALEHWGSRNGDGEVLPATRNGDGAGHAGHAGHEHGGAHAAHGNGAAPAAATPGDGAGHAGHHHGESPAATAPGNGAGHTAHEHGAAPPVPGRGGGGRPGQAHAAEPPAPANGQGAGHAAHARGGEPAAAAPEHDATHAGHGGGQEEHAHGAEPAPPPADGEGGGHHGHAHGAEPAPPADGEGGGHHGHAHGAEPAPPAVGEGGGEDGHAHGDAHAGGDADAHAGHESATDPPRR